MTFFMVGGIVSVIVAIVLIGVYILATRMGEENSLAGKIICWLGMLFGVAGAALMTIEYSFPQISHPEWYETSTSEPAPPTTEPEPPFTDYVTVCIVAQFQIDYEECEIITIYTTDHNPYYLTDIRYRKDYDNNIYKTEYISSVNDAGELIVKHVED